jgi:P pilus assembly chaperone PapD
MRRAAAVCLLLSAGFVPAPASAQLAIDRLWVDFEPGAPNRSDLVIRNESADRYYITVSPVEVTSPGAADEQRVEKSDPEQLGLLVSPNRLVVDPGGMRAIRVVSLNEQVATDRVYRIRVTPQVGEIQADAPGADARGMTVKLLTAYDVLVTVRPPKPNAGVSATRAGNEVTIRNAGNTNTLLFDGVACSPGATPGAAENCEDVGARRLYPANEWKITLKDPNAKLRFKERRYASSEPREVAF